MIDLVLDAKHVMTKDDKTKVVCGMCSVELEVEGWIEAPKDRKRGSN